MLSTKRYVGLLGGRGGVCEVTGPVYVPYIHNNSMHIKHCRTQVAVAMHGLAVAMHGVVVMTLRCHCCPL